MSRIRPTNRLMALISAATTVFSDLGYKRAQMADVAGAMGVSTGTLYLYVKGKAALFDLVIRDALGLIDHTDPPEFPIVEPPPGSTLALVRPLLLAERLVPELADALTRDRVKGATNPCEEFAGIVTGLYRVMTANRHALVVLEKSAYDWPELAEVFFEGMRERLLVDLIRYLELRIEVAQVRPLSEPRLAALEILQTLAWFSQYRRRDVDLPDLDDSQVCESLVDNLSHAFLATQYLPPATPPGARQTE
jgi:AcrR family transcriptional regulator